MELEELQQKIWEGYLKNKEKNPDLTFEQYEIMVITSINEANILNNN